MSSATAPPTDSTWRDWLPEDVPEPSDDELLTRDELLDVLRARGIDLSGRRLLYWETRGILPRPVRRRYRGATRVVYPPWIVDLVAAIPNLQSGGLPLADIQRRLRAAIPKTASDHGTIGAIESASVQVFPVPTEVDFADLLETAARRFEALSGLAAGDVELTISDKTGEPHTYRLRDRSAS